MQVEFKVDYLQFSANRKPAWLLNSIDDYQTKSNKPFYTHMTRYANGAVQYSGNPNTDKHLFVLSGTVCSSLGVSKPIWLQSLINDHATVSRIDLCCTVDEKILDKVLASNEKIVSGRYSEIKVISDQHYTPETIYIGDMKKRAKKGIVRCYDKAYQLGIDDIMDRIEIECKRSDAHLATKRLASGEQMQAVMNSRFRIEDDWYREIFGNDVSTKRFDYPDDTPMREIDRKMLWLEKQVIPTLQYVIDYDKESGTSNFARLLDKLDFES